MATISPTGVVPGLDVDVKITGKNFAQGAKVSFANPGIRVMGVTSPSGTELIVHIKVAKDAAPGTASLFVINPDDREVETPFQVFGKAAPAPATPAPPRTPSAVAGTQSFEAFHLGSPTEIFHTHGKVKGALVLSAGTIQYEEGGKTLINLALGDIKEIATSSFPPATFHITLTSGKTYHFAPGSLRPGDARNIVDALRSALPH